MDELSALEVLLLGPPVIYLIAGLKFALVYLLVVWEKVEPRHKEIGEFQRVALFPVVWLAWPVYARRAYKASNAISSAGANEGSTAS